MPFTIIVLRMRFSRRIRAKDISAEFPKLGQSAIYCVTEVHSKGDLDRLAHAFGEVLR